MPSRGYTTSSRQAQAPSAFYEIFQTDFGELPPATPSLAYNSGAGSLGSGTAYCQITWVTAEGESLPCTQGSVAISAGSGAFTITQPSVPTNGAAVIGWRVYSAGTTGQEKLNTAGTTQTPSSVVTTQGTLAGVFAVTVTSVQVTTYGTGSAVPTYDQSGIQQPLPSIAANTTVDYYARIPNSGALWDVVKSVGFMRPQGLTENAGITTGNMDCIAPVYPGTAFSGTSQANWDVTLGSYCVINGYLFWATVGGDVASTFVPWTSWNTQRGGTTTDGSATWTCLGKAVLVRIHFSNSSTGSLTPVAQEYDLFLQ